MLSKEALARIKRIEISTRKRVGEFFSGQYSSIFKGQGMTFSDVRPYQSGDDIRRIDWNVSARMREPYIKQFVEERELTLALLVDVSASQQFGTKVHAKLRLAAELAALFAFLAIKNNDRISLIAFSDHIEKFVPPKKGRKHVLRLTNDILSIQPQGTGTNWQEALGAAKGVLRRRAVVVMISDFIGLNDFKGLKAFALRHDVIPLWLKDPFEQMLPDVGFLTLQDSETGQAHIFDTSSKAMREHYRHKVLLDYQKINDIFRNNMIKPIEIINGQDYTKPLLSYFKLRSKKSRR